MTGSMDAQGNARLGAFERRTLMRDLDAYVGLDVHEETITGAIAAAGREGEVRSWGAIPDERTAIDRMPEEDGRAPPDGFVCI